MSAHDEPTTTTADDMTLVRRTQPGKVIPAGSPAPLRRTQSVRGPSVHLSKLSMGSMSLLTTLARPSKDMRANNATYEQMVAHFQLRRTNSLQTIPKMDKQTQSYPNPTFVSQNESQEPTTQHEEKPDKSPIYHEAKEPPLGQEPRESKPSEHFENHRSIAATSFRVENATARDSLHVTMAIPSPTSIQATVSISVEDVDGSMYA